jgi:hypothetical protein
MALPHIFFAHAGRQQYFIDALAAAAPYGFVHVVDLARSEPPDSEQYVRLRAAYVHLSGNSVTFELHWCIRRYFLLRDDFARHGIAEGWMLDSDLVLVGPLPAREEFPPGTYCALSYQTDADPLDHHASAHSSFWTLEALEDFCAFVTDLYVNRAQELRDLDRARKEKGIRSAVGEMIVLYMWARDNPRVYDAHDFVAGGMLDHNMRHLEQPRGVMLKGIAGNKAVTVRADGVFCETAAGVPVRMRSLHFQGKAKILIHDFVQGHTGKYGFKAAARSHWDRVRLALRRLKAWARGKAG